MARKAKNTILFGLMPQIMFFIAMTRVQVELEVFYILFYVLLVIQVFWFWYETGEKPIDISEYDVKEVPMQGLGGLIAAGFVTLPFAVLNGLRPTIGPNFLDDIVTQGIFVAFVETFFLIVVIETLRFKEFPVGKYVWAPLFLIFHPNIRQLIAEGVVNSQVLMSILYVLLFGILFEFLYIGRTNVKKPYGSLFGSVTTWTAHFIVNIVVILFPVMLFGLILFPV